MRPYRVGFVVVCAALAALVGGSRKLRARPEDALPPVFPDRVYDAQPGPDVPPLAALLAGVADDAQATARLRAFLGRNRARLRTLWREDDPTRLAGLFAMYVVHVSVPYGRIDHAPASLVEFAGSAKADCGSFARAERIVARGLGLDARMRSFESGWHGWVEIRVRRRWEIFDASTNVWMDRPMDEVVRGLPRHYRKFYSPLTDEARPDARAHLALGYNAPLLRALLPCLGLCFRPGWAIESDDEPVAVAHGGGARAAVP